MEENLTLTKINWADLMIMGGLQEEYADLLSLHINENYEYDEFCVNKKSEFITEVTIFKDINVIDNIKFITIKEDKLYKLESNLKTYEFTDYDTFRRGIEESK